MSGSDLRPAGRAPVHHLDRADVLEAVVEQLRKDLSLAPQDLPQPPVGEGAFEELRHAVLPRLEELERRGGLQRAMYRVDIPEGHLRGTLAAGGLHALAGECVLRALQKVLTRLRFAGRY